MALGGNAHPYPELLALVREAEQLGYAAAFVDGDVSQRSAPGVREVAHGWSLHLALLAATERIAIGSIRLVHHWNACALAQAAATAERLFGERFRLLCSVGGQPADRHFGLPFPKAADRVRWLDETLTVARRLWRGESVSFAGAHVHCDEARLQPAPGDEVPIAIAARGPKLLEVVARHARGWDINVPPIATRVDRAAAALDAACAREGRDPGEIARSQWIHVRPGGEAGSDQLVAGFRRTNPWFEAIPDEELSEGLVGGSPKACLERLAELRDRFQLDLQILELTGIDVATTQRVMNDLAPGTA